MSSALLFSLHVIMWTYVRILWCYTYAVICGHGIVLVLVLVLIAEVLVLVSEVLVLVLVLEATVLETSLRTGTRISYQKLGSCVMHSGTRFFWYQKLGWNGTQLYSVPETWHHMIQMHVSHWSLSAVDVICYCINSCWAVWYWVGHTDYRLQLLIQYDLAKSSRMPDIHVPCVSQ